MSVALRFLLLALIAVLAHAAGRMYADDHWQYATKLTNDNFDEKIKEAVDQGKTMFVRWIASEG